LKILYAVHQFFPDYYAGTERLVLHISKQMQRMGHKTVVLTYDLSSETRGYETRGNFLLKKYSYQSVPVMAVKHRTPQNNDQLNFPIFLPDLEKLFDTILSEESFDIVHVYHACRVGSIVKSSYKKGIPVVISTTDFWLMCPRALLITHTGDLCEGPEGGKKCVKECYGYAWYERLLDRYHDTRELFHYYCNAGTSGTHCLADHFEKNDLGNNFHIIRFGEDYQYINPNKRKYSDGCSITLGFLSTVMPHKGAHILLDAYEKANCANITVKIYGEECGHTEYMHGLRTKYGSNPGIEFSGTYQYEEMDRIFNEIDVVVLPSLWWENSPLVLIRALAQNVPAIVTDLGGMTELVTDGVNGYTFKAGNADALAEIIIKISTNPVVLNSLKGNIRPPSHVEEEAFAYERIYYDLLENYRTNKFLAKMKYLGINVQSDIYSLKKRLIRSLISVVSFLRASIHAFV
jgi:glycosyltransferase involved in cell wall biosynthesis